MEICKPCSIGWIANDDDLMMMMMMTTTKIAEMMWELDGWHDSRLESMQTRNKRKARVKKVKETPNNPRIANIQ